jgi:endonuclease G
VRPRFDSRFLGENRRVAWPCVQGTARQIHYLHFSVVMNPARRLPWYVAYNVKEPTHEARRERHAKWIPDPLVALEFQPTNDHFKRSGFDRGHLAARSSLAWGELRDAHIASRQAFFWTNTAPQHPSVNRGSYLSVEVWERSVSQQLGPLVVLCGPVLGDDDVPFRDEQLGDDGFVAFGTFRVPRAYWKVVVASNDRSSLLCRAFRFDNPGPEERGPRGRPNPDMLTVKLEELQQETRLDFPEELLEAGVLEL